jgi:hypothetical protein
MKSSELRIGNITSMGIVYLIEDDIFRVKNNEGDSLKNTFADIQPIKLTPEWLNKSELEKLGERNIWQKGRFSILYQSYHDPYGQLCKDKFYFLTIDMDKNVVITSFKIEYVHNLQNIYFSLEGEELTFKSEK